MGRKRKNVTKKEDIAEDYCFICKDGGMLRVCDYKHCLKAFHPACVKKTDALLETEERWFCAWHYCFSCSKSAKFHCFSCPFAVCGRCLWDAEFVLVKGQRGFCNHCLELALLIEENKDVNSDGGTIDFNDQGTYEFLFKGYWELTKKKQGLTREHLHSADSLLKNGKNYAYDSDSNDICTREEDSDEIDDESRLILSDYDDLNDIDEHKSVHKRSSKKKRCLTIRKPTSKKMEFIGWASKPLLEFLESIGKKPTQVLSHYDVTSIITGYCQENKLFHPKIKKKVICDARLQAILGRKSVNKNGIHKHLSAHFSENLDLSEDEIGCSSADNDENTLVTYKRSYKLSTDRKSQKEVVLDGQKSFFASLVAKNIKLVYLKRSLVEELVKHLDTFDGKVMGSFVRVKSDPNDYLQKNSHQLVQVTGIKKTSGSSQMNSQILLQVSNMLKDVPTCKLSDDDFSEEECEDLRRRVKDGLIRSPTVVELEQKARILHEDITKHWIVGELALLQNRIDRANEKGWRRELFEYMDSLLLLQTPQEQSRLLNEVPEVIADVAEPDAILDDSLRINKQQHDASQASALEGVFKSSSNDLKSNRIFCRAGRIESEGDRDAANEKSASGVMGSGSPCDDGESKEAFKKNFIEKNGKEEKLHQYEASVSKEVPQSQIITSIVEDGIHQRERHQLVREVKHDNLRASVSGLSPRQSHACASEGKFDMVVQRKQHNPGYDTASKDQNQPANGQIEDVKKKSALTVELIELSDDEEQENMESSIWYSVSSLGDIRGPYSMSVLKKWSDSSCYKLKYKVFKTGQSPEKAILLDDVIRQNFSEN